MSLHFVLGPSGSGKTRELFELAIREAKAHPERMYYFLVPEQFSLKTQYNLLSVHPDGGILNIDVTSMARLANAAFAKLNGMEREFIPEIGKSMIIKKVLIDHGDSLIMYGKNSKHPGFVAEAKALLSELWQYHVTNEELAEMIHSSGAEPLLQKKLKDAYTIMSGFEEHLGGKLLTNENMYDAFADVLEKSGLMKDAVVIMDGFTGFTPSQYEILKSFMRLSKDMYVSFTIDRETYLKPYESVKPYDRFFMSKDATEKLKRLAADVSCEIGENIYTTYDKYENMALSHLERHLFKTGAAKVSSMGAVTIYKASCIEKEAKYVAANIERLIRCEGLRYKDIAVVVSDPEAYGECLAKELDKVKVQYFLDRSRSLYENECSSLITTVLRIMEKEPDTKLLLDYAKNGFSNISFEDACLLENYCIAFGIKGYRFKTPFAKEKKTGQVIDLAYVNGIRKALMDEISGLIGVKRGTVKETATRLYNFFLHIELEDKLKSRAEELRRRNEILKAKEYSEVYRAVTDIINQLVRFMGDEELSTREFREITETGLAEASVGLVPHGNEQIIIGDIERTRLSGIRVLFVMGANDGKLPKIGTGKGIITERDKETLREKGKELSPSHLRKVGKDRFYLYLAFTKPTYKLFISYPTQADGEETKVSPLLKDIKNLYNDLEEICFDKLDRFTMILENDKGHELKLKNVRELNEKELAVKKDFKPDVLLPETAEALYGEKLTGSISRLETFARCPFRHFMQYGMCAGERDTYELSPLDYGNVAHETLEKYGKELLKEGRKWQLVEANERRELLNRCAEEAIAEHKQGVFSESEKNMYIAERVTQALDITVEALTKQLSVGDFEPKYMEKPIKTENDSYVFKGTIDRIDICDKEGLKAVKIVDYKTGNREFDIVDLYYGISMQLPVYMKKALDMLNGEALEKEDESIGDRLKRIMDNGKYKPAAMLYNVIKDPYAKEDTDAYVKHLDEYAPTEGSYSDYELSSVIGEFTPKGLINKSSAVITSLDHAFMDAAGGVAAAVSSDYINVKTDENAVIADSSGVCSEKDMQLLLEFADKKVAKQVDKIKSGDVSALPISKDGERQGCNLCAYKQVCGLDMQNGGRERKLKNYNSEEIWQKIKGGADDGID